MKRRTFLTGLLASSALLGLTIKADVPDVVDIFTWDEPFYDFFKKFNGFEISQYQKFLYEAYINNQHYMLTYGRQVYGISTLLLTLAAWESQVDYFHGDTVFISSNSHLNKIRQSILKHKESELGISFPVRFVNIENIPFAPCGKSVRTAFYDCSGDWHSDWKIIKPLVYNKTFTVRTVDI